MAKLSRRSALMAAVGSIFGGKDAAKSILDTGALMRGESMLKGGYMGEGAQKGNIHSYPAGQIEEYDKQIANLTRLMNGGLDEWQQKHLESTRHLRQRQELFRIDNLKSVSQVYKLSMADRHNKELCKEDWKLEAARELKNVLNYKNNFLKNIAGKVFEGRLNSGASVSGYDTPGSSRG